MDRLSTTRFLVEFYIFHHIVNYFQHNPEEALQYVPGTVHSGGFRHYQTTPLTKDIQKLGLPLCRLSSHINSHRALLFFSCSILHRLTDKGMIYKMCSPCWIVCLFSSPLQPPQLLIYFSVHPAVSS